tara:strand:+ start:80 stop:325 length:246 start_codon:yes stop_codon:yes gene_type:complete
MDQPPQPKPFEGLDSVAQVIDAYIKARTSSANLRASNAESALKNSTRSLRKECDKTRGLLEVIRKQEEIIESYLAGMWNKS